MTLCTRPTDGRSIRLVILQSRTHAAQNRQLRPLARDTCGVRVRVHADVRTGVAQYENRYNAHIINFCSVRSVGLGVRLGFILTVAHRRRRVQLAPSLHGAGDFVA